MSASRPRQPVGALALLLLLLNAAAVASLTHHHSSPPLPHSPFPHPHTLASLLQPRVVHTLHNVSVTSVAFPITPSAPFQFGVALDGSDDFDVLYQLTLVQQSTSDPSSSSTPLTPAVTRKVCLFVIGASSAANPQISAFSYNGGAQCTWKINPGVGEDFWAA